MDLTIEVNQNFIDKQPKLGSSLGTVLITPPLDGDYFIARVVLHEDQAINIFPKFGMIGCGFAQEEDWNTNLPIACRVDKIYEHIKHNKKYKAIKAEDCKAAIKLLQDWCLQKGLIDQEKMDRMAKD